MGMHRRTLAAAFSLCVIGCADPAPPVAPTSPSTSGLPASHLVSGTVLERVDGGVRGVANQFLTLITVETRGLPPGMVKRTKAQSLSTDASGRYSAHVPTSIVFVSAAWGKRQPCVASAPVSQDTTLDVEVFAGSSSPPSGASPRITGFVYETTPSGRRPLKGAALWLDLASDAYVAATETDDLGQFYFCHVSADVRLDVSVEGYQPYQHSAFLSGATDSHIEFEFRR